MTPLPKPVKRIKAKRSLHIMHRVSDGKCERCGPDYRRKPLKRSRPRRKRKGGPAALAREADRLWSLLVRARGSCEACGETERLQGAHGFSRRYRAIRWLPINGFALCAKDHVYYTHRPLEWEDFLRIAWGDAVFDELRVQALRHEKPDLEAIVESLRCELQRSTNGGK